MLKNKMSYIEIARAFEVSKHDIVEKIVQRGRGFASTASGTKKG